MWTIVQEYQIISIISFKNELSLAVDPEVAPGVMMGVEIAEDDCEKERAVKERGGVSVWVAIYVEKKYRRI